MGTSIHSFKDLEVWQVSMQLVKHVYQVTDSLPKSEQFGLVVQSRRSAVSIPSNISEGTKRGTRRDYAQFLRMASGSAAELETQLLLIRDLFPTVSLDQTMRLLLSVQKMLTVMIKKLATP